VRGQDHLLTLRRHLFDKKHQDHLSFPTVLEILKSQAHHHVCLQRKKAGQNFLHDEEGILRVRFGDHQTALDR
jgi:hypothetical protein